MLTRSSWVKIALITLLCLCLCTGVLSCSFGCTPWIRSCAAVPGLPSWNGADYPNVGSASIKASQVRDIELDWFAGRVEFSIVDDSVLGGEIRWEENAGSRQLEDRCKLRWVLDGDRLRIAYWETSTALAGCSGFNQPAKTLIISIPKSACENLGTISLNAFSGEYNLDGLSCDTLEIDLASGRIDGSGAVFGRVDAEVASGTLNLEGEVADDLRLEMASGDVNITCTGHAPSTIGVSMASGNAVLTMPADAGITANVDKLSGAFDFDMPDSHTYDDSYICGDGSTSLNVDMSSGRVVVRS